MQCHPKMVTETYSSTWWLITTRMFSKNNEHSNKSRVIVGIVGRKSLHTLYSPLIVSWPCFVFPSSKYGDFRQYEPDSDVFICHLMLSISWIIGKIYHHNSKCFWLPRNVFLKNPGTFRTRKLQRFLKRWTPDVPAHQVKFGHENHGLPVAHAGCKVAAMTAAVFVETQMDQQESILELKVPEQKFLIKFPFFWLRFPLFTFCRLHFEAKLTSGILPSLTSDSGRTFSCYKKRVQKWATSKQPTLGQMANFKRTMPGIWLATIEWTFVHFYVFKLHQIRFCASRHLWFSRDFSMHTFKRFIEMPMTLWRELLLQSFYVFGFHERHGYSYINISNYRSLPYVHRIYKHHKNRRMKTHEFQAFFRVIFKTAPKRDMHRKSCLFSHQKIVPSQPMDNQIKPWHRIWRWTKIFKDGNFNRRSNHPSVIALLHFQKSIQMLLLNGLKNPSWLVVHWRAAIQRAEHPKFSVKAFFVACGKELVLPTLKELFCHNQLRSTMILL